MKHTSCKVPGCNQNFEDWTYDKMMAHANKHLKDMEEAKNQTSMESF